MEIFGPHLCIHTGKNPQETERLKLYLQLISMSQNPMQYAVAVYQPILDANC